MKLRHNFSLAVVLALAALLLAQVPAYAEKKLTPKIDNFIVLFDMSGSMAWGYAGTDQSKAQHALEDLKAMNQMIPELGYKSGLATVASYEKYAGLAPYSRSAYASNIGDLGPAVDAKTLLGPNTPLGDGMAQAGKDFGPGLKGKTAIIIFSDGGLNAGRDAVAAAEAVNKASNGNICFDTVSYATTPAAQKLLDDIAAVGGCGYSVTAADMADSGKRAQFVKDVFYTETEVSKPAPAPVVAPKPLTMRLEILFDFDKSDIKAKYVPEVEKVAKLLKENPEATVAIDGHTDGIGTDAYNMKLSQRRADAVRDYLVKKLGIKADRITAQGFGKSQPIASNDTDAGRAQNRRVVAIFNGLYEK
ncbi:OmpA/MotB domain protein [Desulfovibrio sp. X2]|uniref:OmpA family protein n=1 Tax=Desulfovibrio sp. X2 TaxID=941449 RepID=UPI0003588834|nr:OmpA family protein [Desulfovibrio sp. X2]EPR43432.1 OmpA/MotB domain protein [Desulfovibrio sp. X2]